MAIITSLSQVAFASVIDILLVLGFTAPTFWEKASWQEGWSNPGDFNIKTAVMDALVVVVIRTIFLQGTAWLSYYMHVVFPKVEEENYDLGRSNVHVSSVQGNVVYSLVSETDDPFEKHMLRERYLYGKRVKRETIDTWGYIISFIVLTSTGVFLAIKAISMDYAALTHHTKERSILLCVCALGSHVLFAITRSYQSHVTSGQGELMPKLHAHKIVYGERLCRWCDVCNTRIQKDGYSCQDCDFDSCLTCYRKVKVNSSASMGGVWDLSMKSRNNNASGTTEYIKRSLRLLAPFKFSLLAALTCLLINQSARLFLPNYQGSVIDSVISHDRDAFWRYLFVYIGLTAGIVVFGSVRSAFLGIVGRNLNNAIRCKLFRSLIYQDIAFFDASTVGQLTARMTNDANAMVAPINTLVDTVLSNVILLVGALILCFFTAWKLSILAFCAVGPIVYISGVYAKWSRQVNRSIWDALANGNSIATESFTNIRTVRSFSRERSELKKYDETMGEALQRAIKDSFASAMVSGWTNLIDLGVIALILAFGGKYAIDGDGITVGQLITFQLYANLMNTSYQALNNVLNQFTRSAGAATRVLNLIDMMPNIDPDAGVRLTSIQGQFDFKNVTFHYPMRRERAVLKDLNLTLESGKVTAIVGKSGAGKTTILHLLMRFYDPDMGDIFVDRDYGLKDLNLNVYHDHIALVSQDTQLFAQSIEDNIKYGAVDPTTVTHEDVVRVAKLSYVDEFVEGFEEKYKTKVGERGVRLSGGQRQRIGIARALLRDPRILCLDEATSALDAESEAKVMIGLRNLMQGDKTVVIVAHRLSTVQNADKIVVLSGGKVSEIGTHAELVAREGGVYAKLVRHQLASGRSDLTDDVFDLVEKEMSSTAGDIQ